MSNIVYQININLLIENVISNVKIECSSSIFVFKKGNGNYRFKYNGYILK